MGTTILQKKEWLKHAAKNVKNNSEIYNSQLKGCEKKLNNKPELAEPSVFPSVLVPKENK